MRQEVSDEVDRRADFHFHMSQVQSAVTFCLTRVSVIVTHPTTERQPDAELQTSVRTPLSDLSHDYCGDSQS